MRPASASAPVAELAPVAAPVLETPTTAAPTVTPTTAAPVPTSVAPTPTTLPAVTPTTAARSLSPDDVVWTREGGYCQETSRATADAIGATPDASCPANQPASGDPLPSEGAVWLFSPSSGTCFATGALSGVAAPECDQVTGSPQSAG